MICIPDGVVHFQSELHFRGAYLVKKPLTRGKEQLQSHFKMVTLSEQRASLRPSLLGFERPGH